MTMTPERARLQDTLGQWRRVAISNVGRTPRQLGIGIWIQPIAVVGMFKDATAGLALAGRRRSSLGAQHEGQRGGKKDFGVRAGHLVSHAILLQDALSMAAPGPSARLSAPAQPRRT